MISHVTDSKYLRPPDFVGRRRAPLQPLSFLVSWPAAERRATLAIPGIDDLDDVHYEMTRAQRARRGYATTDNFFGTLAKHLLDDYDASDRSARTIYVLPSGFEARESGRRAAMAIFVMALLVFLKSLSRA
jgi:hypothetical protein